MANLARHIDFKELGDARGNLVVMEGDDSIPFHIKRIYYIYNTEQGVARGFHAHHHLKQVIVAVRGRCEMHLDNGKEKEIVVLDDPCKAIVIDTMIWRELHHFSEDCIILCLASEHYDESDYIRDYDTFMKEVSGK